MRFPKSARLRTSAEFKRLQRQGCRHIGEQLLIQFRQGLFAEPKLGITVSKKFGKAHERNRFKRVVREAFRELYPLFPQEIEIHISPQKNRGSLTKQAVILELQLLLSKILS